MIFDIEHFSASDWSAVIAAILAFLTAGSNVLAGKAQSKVVDKTTETADASIQLAQAVSKDIGSSLKLTTKALSKNLVDIGNRTSAVSAKLDDVIARLDRNP